MANWKECFCFSYLLLVEPSQLQKTKEVSLWGD